jgi:hypothetical protein
LKIRFVAKVGVSGKYDKDRRKKFYILIPRQYIDQIEDFEGDYCGGRILRNG